ncbi:MULTISPECIES: glycerophosphodiester phosphodiesterase family protein [Shewanella]|uniref:glycerophosphodiester phosphodiesterase n=1 Tax=Shewanella vesiculosa TaxID=518738 RepID=A0ABV0FQ99_9GAMM|nr:MULTISPECIES: glycerophosphodiester phosphodiesterase family protein [Shewanella]NCQ45244.1 glycerophosphodiester phosphodiesterase [Shewanella frigidimarina]MBB1321063.1 glycerophosphodiester phosphodiesterase [Shewanella sp. SR43-8]NCO70768.1 glycerophosphodiester phosphodiesterase [Shewanella vesiculosa]NCP36885.1 glycerophosphodiester phosphodiesterase [Shewanella vesiculosa]NCP69022.1 glycerophosphodiester phosphodiesterase [Shewanella vesiculosa]|tara:strand:+ start:3102 stop:4379 length:1278 start_codon:yes stop_codon:yes gene_type:complete
MTGQKSITLGIISILTSMLWVSGCNSNDNNDTASAVVDKSVVAQVGPRPLFLVDQMQDSELKTQLAQCETGPFYRTDFAIGHRGASMQFPEHTKESYQAAIDSGAGIVECDVTFTADKALVCRHSQCDLATTTNILAIPELANKCSVPFSPADAANGVSATATCCTSDITLAEFKTLKGKMDGFNPKATTVAEFIDGTPNWRTDLYAGNGTLMTHAESIALFKAAGVKMTPELKSASVSMPYDGFTQQDYAQKMLDEYAAAGVDASQVFPQSFNLDDVKYWIANAPEFAEQAVYLDGRDEQAGFDPQNSATWSPSMDALAADGVKIIAPPLWMLVTLDNNKAIIPSEYANAANAAGLKIIAWSLERSGPLSQGGGGWYYQSIADAIDNEGDTFELLDVLAKDVGVIGVFSDWPATVTYYANCMNM